MGHDHLSYAEGYGEHFDDVARRRPNLTQLRSIIDFIPRWTLTETIDDLISREREGFPSRISPMAQTAQLVDAG